MYHVPCKLPSLSPPIFSLLRLNYSYWSCVSRITICYVYAMLKKNGNRYGGQLLGPVRFTHIESCTREVCRSFKAMEEVEAITSELTELDATLARLRTELASLTAATAATATVEAAAQDVNTESEIPKPNLTRSVEYRKTLLSPPDVPKARRLLTARQNAIKSVNGVLARVKEGGTGNKE